MGKTEKWRAREKPEDSDRTWAHSKMATACQDELRTVASRSIGEWAWSYLVSRRTPLLTQWRPAPPLAVKVDDMPPRCRQVTASYRRSRFGMRPVSRFNLADLAAWLKENGRQPLSSDRARSRMYQRLRVPGTNPFRSWRGGGDRAGAAPSSDPQDHLVQPEAADKVADQAATVTSTLLAVLLEKLFAGCDQVAHLAQDPLPGHHRRLRQRLLLMLARQRVVWSRPGSRCVSTLSRHVCPP
jgi:hypothetical protein